MIFYACFVNRTVVLFLVLETEWNMYDQRAMEYAAEKVFLEKEKTSHVIRRTPEQMRKAQLREDGALIMQVSCLCKLNCYLQVWYLSLTPCMVKKIIVLYFSPNRDDLEIAVIYFRNLYGPQNYNSEEVG